MSYHRDAEGRDRYEIEIESVGISPPEDDEAKFRLTIKSKRLHYAAEPPMSIEVLLDQPQAQHLRKVLRSGMTLLRVQSSQWPGSDSEA